MELSPSQRRINLLPGSGAGVHRGPPSADPPPSVDDALEQLRLDRAIGRGRHGLVGFFNAAAGLVESDPAPRACSTRR
jgi:hypothetical protein